MNTEESAYLLERYFYDLATHAEREALFRALEENPDAEQWQMLMLKLIPANQPQADMEQKYEDMLWLITRKQAKVKKMRRRYWLWAAASAVFILALGIYLYAYYNHRQPVVTAAQSTDVAAPQVNRAMITLADGSTVFLDSAGSGQLAMQGSVKLVKLSNGQIAYRNGNGKATEIQYNTLVNPRGSRVIDMTLADGTRVWLNAGSSLTYPVAFTGAKRNVEVNGEAYFEVAHDKTKPFYVSKGDVEVKVLGTHFNVNAYDEEPDIKVTLLEGLVNVSGNKGSVLIKPGSQASIAPGYAPQIIGNVDVEQVMAWKNGWFRFSGADIEAVMRQAARWYDVDVVYEGRINGTISGGIPRDVNISGLLHILELTNKISFEIEGRQIIVKPVKQHKMSP